MSTRIYLVRPKNGTGKSRLVRATTPAAALRHVMQDTFDVGVASQDDLVRVLMAQDGARVEAVNAEDEPADNPSTN